MLKNPSFNHQMGLGDESCWAHVSEKSLCHAMPGFGPCDVRTAELHPASRVTEVPLEQNPSQPSAASRFGRQKQ